MSAKYRLDIKTKRRDSRWVQVEQEHWYCTVEVGITISVGEGLCIVGDALGLSPDVINYVCESYGDEVFIPLYTCREFDIETGIGIVIEMFDTMHDLGFLKRWKGFNNVSMMKLYLGKNSVLEKIKWMER